MTSAPLRDTPPQVPLAARLWSGAAVPRAARASVHLATIVALCLPLLTACGAAQLAQPATPVAAGATGPSATAPSDPGAGGDVGPAAPAPRPLAERIPLPPVLEADGEVERKATDDGLDGAWARVFLRANPGPFQYVAYELSARGSAAVASHLRGMMGRRDAVIRTELVDRALLRRVLDRLDAIGVAQMEAPAVSPLLVADQQGVLTAPPQSPLPIYEITWRRGGAERTMLVVDPYGQDDGIYARFIDIVRDEVQRAVGSIGYHGPDATGTAKGYLFIDSVPSADVWVDDEKLPERTPVLNWTLAPGVHRVRLHRADLGLDKTSNVRIEAGMTTSLELDLR